MAELVAVDVGEGVAVGVTVDAAVGVGVGVLVDPVKVTLGVEYGGLLPVILNPRVVS